MGLVPYAVDTPLFRYPVANYALVCVTVLSTFLLWANPRDLAPYMIVGAPFSSSVSWVGYMFAHGGWLHLVGNMIFLYVFGNAVCAKMGDGRYLSLYFAGGLVAAAAQSVVAPGAMVGASGAINAVVGAYLLLFPRHRVRYFIFLLFRIPTFALPSYFVILTWFAFDVWGALSGEGRIAYGAHIGGFLFGAGVMAVLLKRGWVETNDVGDESLFQAFERKRSRKREIADYQARLSAKRATASAIREQEPPAPRVDPVDPAAAALPAESSAHENHEDDGVSLVFGDPIVVAVPPPSPEPQPTTDVPATGQNAADIPASRWNQISPMQTETAADTALPPVRSAMEGRVRVSCEHCGHDTMIAVRPGGGQGICSSCWQTISVPPS